MCDKIKAFSACFMLLLILCPPAQPQTAQVNAPVPVVMRGKVVYPDGAAAAGAQVFVASICTNTTVHRAVDTLTTALDGSFSLKSFDPDCDIYGFEARKEEAQWLKTGEDVFYAGVNGTSPIVKLEAGKPVEPIIIQLGERGGDLSLRVFDEASRSFIDAGLSFRREPLGGKTFGIVSMTTGHDRSSLTRLFPAGDYVVGIDRYVCKGKTYWVAAPPKFNFSIKSGETQPLTAKINLAELATRSSYDNIKAERCIP